MVGGGMQGAMEQECSITCKCSDIELPSELCSLFGCVDGAVEGDEESGAVDDHSSFLAVVVSDAPGSDGKPDAHQQQPDVESQQLLDRKVNDEAPELMRNDPAVGFLEAWRIPGVATFALCLFFSKLVAYTFLYWLPFYIRQTRKFPSCAHSIRAHSQFICHGPTVSRRLVPS